MTLLADTDGPFEIGDRVVVYDASEQTIVGRGVIDGESTVPGDDDHYFYDVRTERGRFEGVSEMLLDWEQGR